MAHSYTPGLKVLGETLVEKARILPLKGKVLKEIGATCEPDDICCSTNLPGNVQMVNIANRLNVEAIEIPELMKKSEGDAVSKGDIIAESLGIFGFFKSQIHSPADGTIEAISSVTGQVVLREAPIPVEVDAYISGRIKEVIPEEGVIIETEAAMIQGIFGIGGESRGELVMLATNRDEELDPDFIKPEHKGKVIVGGSFVSIEAFRKAQSVGVKGIVVGGFDYNKLKDLLGYTLGVAITGTENLGVTMVVTEGFGKMHMAKRTFELLQQHEGDFASISGATQIRAGVIRPEIVIPLNKDMLRGNTKIKEVGSMEKGSLVRIIRAPYFGKIGTVQSLPPELTKMESETMVRVAIIRLSDDSDVLVPRANLEMVETD
jgi:hypothetical protein